MDPSGNPQGERLYLQIGIRPNQAVGHVVDPVFKCVNSKRGRPLIIRIGAVVFINVFADFTEGRHFAVDQAHLVFALVVPHLADT